MSAEELKPCTYRRAQYGDLICTIAKLSGGSTSNIVNAALCEKCSIPEALSLSNCMHLQSGLKIFGTQTYGGWHSQIAGLGYSCDVYQFEDHKALFAQCQSECPKRNAIHRDVSRDALLIVKALPEDPTDRDIRQGVLIALYEYHARLPERFLKFDVTPTYLSDSLNLPIAAIYRVLAPMDEANEVRTIQNTGDFYPKYVTITQRGIESIQHEPLFESKGIRVTDNSIKIDGNNNQVARERGHNQQVNIQGVQGGIEQVLQGLTALRTQLQAAEVSQEFREEAYETIDIVFEEAQKPEPRPSRIQTGLKAVHRLLEQNPGTVAAAGTAAQIAVAFAAAAVGGS